MILYCSNIPINKKGIKSISDQDTFDGLHDVDFNEFSDGIIIEAELSWNPFFYAQFHGFELIKNLRLVKKIKTPIVICSPLPEEYFAEGKCAVFEGLVVNAPCHYFNEILPGDDYLEKALEILNNANTLDEITLTQSVLKYFDVRNYIGAILHDLRNKETYINNLDDANKYIEQYFDYLAKQPIEKSNKEKLTVFFYDIKSEFNNQFKIIISKYPQVEHPIKMQKVFREIINNNAKRIQALYATSKNINMLEKTFRYPWQVLYIEDETGERDTVVKLFKEKNVICHAVSNYEEAIAYLMKEKSITDFKIGVIISDYRLLKQGSKTKEEDIQGYTALYKIREKILKENFNRPLAYFILTSIETTIKDLAGFTLPFKIGFFSKQDVLQKGGGFNLFFNEITKEANLNYISYLFQPKNKAWTSITDRRTKTFKQYYEEHLSQSDYKESERQINKGAMEFIKNSLEKKANNEAGWTATYKGDDLEKYRKYFLKGRRITLALSYIGIKKYEIMNCLWYRITKKRGGTEENYEISEMDFKNKNISLQFGSIMNSGMALSENIEELIPNSFINPFNVELLKEEINFLHDNFNYPFSPEMFIDKQVSFYEIRDFFNEIDALLNANNLNDTNFLKELIDKIDNEVNPQEELVNQAIIEINTIFDNIKVKSIKNKFISLFSDFIKKCENIEIRELFEKAMYDDDYSK